MNKGFKAEAKIEKIVYGGSGLTRIDGKVCFVPDTIDGETVIIEVTKERSDFLKATCLRIPTPSHNRIEPQCPLSKVCPGCVYQHISFEHENTLKNNQLMEFLKKNIEVSEGALNEYSAPQSPLGYRNKITLHVQKDGGETLLGYKQPNGTVMPLNNCPIACKEINDKLAELTADKGFFHTLHHGHSLTLRHTEQNDVIYWRNNPPAKMSWLKENMPFGSFSVPAGSFQQVNPHGCNALIEAVTKVINQIQPETVIDLYCGSGLFATTAAAAGVKDIVAVESDEKAIAAVNYNLKQQCVAAPTIISDDVAKQQDTILEKINDKTLLIVDPPRNGLKGKVRNMLTSSKLKKLIYISCGPDTLGRDLRDLATAGFRLEKAQMINMFPRTGHFETFTYLTR
ncbi:MAG: class I SAM-dependent RNA methyltransferase [Lentisphaerae bacterium]|nr:class I SAM-dependent RNA methyltransferase [Lentisphaerota bacterium]MCP4100506.1 class I SAM-dependent RNA methyltransferase [Lentisphaerota bacterium]